MHALLFFSVYVTCFYTNILHALLFSYETTHYRPLGLVGKAKAVSSRLTWSAWVQFLPFF